MKYVKLVEDTNQNKALGQIQTVQKCKDKKQVAASKFEDPASW